MQGVGHRAHLLRRVEVGLKNARWDEDPIHLQPDTGLSVQGLGVGVKSFRV